IPNTAVKPARADGTWGEAPWESRSPPGFLTDEIPPELRLEGISSFRGRWGGRSRRKRHRPGECGPRQADRRGGAAVEPLERGRGAAGPGAQRSGTPRIDAG